MHRVLVGMLATRRLACISRHVLAACRLHNTTPGNIVARALSSGAVDGFRALYIDAEKGKLKERGVKTFGHVQDLPRQDPDAKVTVRVHYSDLNYKDAMIVRGQYGVVRSFPIVPGIDFSGVVQSSDSPMWNPGDEVVLTGNKIGQFVDGGYAELCRVQPEWLVQRPDDFSLEECMVIGTAGVTAMMMVMHLERFGELKPECGDVLVTGAGGGVGSTAVAILAKLGYRVVASTGRPDELGEYFRSLGAADVIGRLEGDGRKRPLQDQRWAGVIECVGGATLVTALAQTKAGGSVAAVGVAESGLLDGTVYPFILRGVRLLGVDSTLPWNVEGYDPDPVKWERARQERLEIWRRLASDLSREALKLMHFTTVPLDDVPTWADKLLDGQVTGRVVVKA